MLQQRREKIKRTKMIKRTLNELTQGRGEKNRKSNQNFGRIVFYLLVSFTDYKQIFNSAVSSVTGCLNTNFLLFETVLVRPSHSPLD